MCLQPESTRCSRQWSCSMACHGASPDATRKNWNRPWKKLAKRQTKICRVHQLSLPMWTTKIRLTVWVSVRRYAFICCGVYHFPWHWYAIGLCGRFVSRNDIITCMRSSLIDIIHNASLVEWVCMVEITGAYTNRWLRIHSLWHSSTFFSCAKLNIYFKKYSDVYFLFRLLWIAVDRIVFMVKPLSRHGKLNIWIMNVCDWGAIKMNFFCSINSGTHHVDVSGEPFYMESMELKYNDLAKEKGVYIVSACGFDSIPADIGVKHFEDNFNGEVHSIESFLKTWKSGKTSGAGWVSYTKYFLVQMWWLITYEFEFLFYFWLIMKHPLWNMGISCVRTGLCIWFEGRAQRTVQRTSAAEWTKIEGTIIGAFLRIRAAMVFAVPRLWSSSCSSFTTCTLFAWEKTTNSNANLHSVRVIIFSYTALLFARISNMWISINW